eukprot:m.78204 g.78204  ORF g.78204 m.78204 type:complete len:69 (-) comp16222_c0_seq3:3604-3810(-)
MPTSSSWPKAATIPLYPSAVLICLAGSGSVLQSYRVTTAATNRCVTWNTSSLYRCITVASYAYNESGA